MEQLSLFNKNPILSDTKKETCRTCIYRERWQLGGTIIQYCAILTNYRTVNGKKKITCKTKACRHYKFNK